ncbi:MAG TPA: NAD(P)H-dependent oxidoreductase [Chitinophagaceae bacterium]|nr:NAD(P)H-dependent oxidoreductase [Chitinophagaceae bacterium]
MIIAIISASVRTGRRSHRMALFFRNFIIENHLADVELLDLNEYKFPIFEERLSNMTNPAPGALQFAEKVNSADGVIIVTPEYNGGYPASLKNAIDLLYKEWKRKPVALATASYGQFGGAQVTTSLVFTLWKIGVRLVPAMYPGPNVQDTYTDEGFPVNKNETEKRAKIFVDELLWYMTQRKEIAKYS